MISTMTTLAHRIAKANILLAPYAVPHGTGLGRVYDEPEDETRFPFQRDRDRIIHTQAFRRLKYKTQVFVSGSGDHYRTRLTHTLEVAQISRDIARTLGLNEDLAEAIALAHDLGHTPFGHAGEEAMSQCMEPYGKRFEHNEQSYRIVTMLEERTNHYTGLNLNREVLEGLQKHRTPHDHPDVSVTQREPSLEAQIVNLADEIAYTAHDTDDGIRSGMFSLPALQDLSLIALASARTADTGTELRGAIVHLLVTDLYDAFGALMEVKKITSLADVYACIVPLVAFSASMRTKLQELRSFLWSHLYLSPDIAVQSGKGRDIIRTLFTSFVKVPPSKVSALQQKTGGALEDAVKDYIAGMTDGFAKEAATLENPKF